jgi:outer membrane biosynthesis protein TonB
MSDSLYRARRDGISLVWFLLFSLVLNGSAAYWGFWLRLPESQPTILTAVDTNDAPPLGTPDAPEEQPPDPQPTPPPDPEPTPPPLDKPPEFEIPAATPTPAPQETPQPHPTPKEKAKEKAKAAPNAAATPGIHKGVANGVVGGTGNGGARSGKLVRSPKPPYPPQALQMHITGDVRLQITVSAGHITNVEPVSGPSILSSTAARWVRSNWEFAPDQTGTFTLPVTFVMH